MAIHINPENEGKLSVDFSNGHLEALRKIVSDYSLKSESEAFTFMLGVFSQAAGAPVEVGGKRLVPSDQLKKV